MKHLLFAVFAALSLTGCGTFANLGIDAERLDTANKQLIAYAGEIEALAFLGTQLVERDIITPEQGLKVASHLQTANDLVVTARAQLADTGDPVAAETTLERVSRSVDLALGILTVFAPSETEAILERNERHDLSIRGLSPV